MHILLFLPMLADWFISTSPSSSSYDSLTLIRSWVLHVSGSCESLSLILRIPSYSFLFSYPGSLLYCRCFMIVPIFQPLEFSNPFPLPFHLLAFQPHYSIYLLCTLSISQLCLYCQHFP